MRLLCRFRGLPRISTPAAAQLIAGALGIRFEVAVGVLRALTLRWGCVWEKEATTKKTANFGAERM